MDIASLLGWIATFLFTIMLFPQIAKTLKTKSTTGVSLWMYLIFLLANIIALVYAIMISQNPLIIKYVLAIIVDVFYLVVYFYYRNKEAV